MRQIVFSLVLCAFAQSAVARKAPVPKVVPGGAAIGIDVTLRTPSGMATGTPDEIFFVMVDAEHGLMQTRILPANYVSGSRAYLLNVVPGDYVAIACSNREAGGKIPILGPLMDQAAAAQGQNTLMMTYFSGALVEATRVSVGAGELAFAGSFRVRQGTMKDADPVAKHYSDLNTRPNRRIGQAEETKRDGETRRAFLARAKDDLAEGGWGEMILAAANPAEKRASAPQSPVALARALADRGEGGEVTEAEFAPKSKAVQEWLAAHPDDVDALIVAARLHWLQQTSTPIGLNAGEKLPDPALAYEPAHKYLDHAIALQPKNAEACYWKARLYGVIAPYIDVENDLFSYRPIDTAQSIAFARKAVELAPAEPQYSVVLAQYLSAHREWKEAIKVLEALPDGRRHPLYAVLSDFEAFPLPEQAVFDPVLTQTVVQAQTERGEFRTFRYERARIYVIPGTVKDLEPFLTQRWPRFSLGKPETEEGMTSYILAYRSVNGKWEAQGRLPKSQQGLMVAMLSEMHQVPPAAMKRLKIAAADSYCVVALANYQH